MTAVLPVPTDPLGVDGADVDRCRADAAKAPLLLGLALALVNDGVPAAEAVDELWDEADGSRRALDGAYGRAVALVSEYPSDAAVHQAVVLLSKALRRGSRPLPAAGA